MIQKFKPVPAQNGFSTASLPSRRSSTQGPTKLGTSSSDGERTASSTSRNSGQDYAGFNSTPLQMELFTLLKAWCISISILRTVNNMCTPVHGYSAKTRGSFRRGADFHLNPVFRIMTHCHETDLLCLKYILMVK